MKKLFITFLLFSSCICQGQVFKKLTDSTALNHEDAVNTSLNPLNSFASTPMYVQPTYPECDTLKCHFLEVVNDSSFEWKTGFVERSNGFIKFADNTSVQPPYLPIASGIVESHLYYLNMQPIKNYAIKVIVIPMDKIKTSVLGY